MSESDTQATASDLQVLNEVLAAVAGRPRLAPVAAAASALAAELGTAEPEPAGPDRGVPPGTVPDVDVPQVTKPRIDQPLGDPPPGAPLGGTVPGVIDAELVDDLPVGPGGDYVGGATTGEFTDSGVPTWDGVREKVEHRSGTAVGAEELDRESRAGRDLDKQWNDRQEAGRKKLDEIRRSMGSS
ncbi:hypothetical protein HQO24_23985 [Rhodococcus fascians]|uniref:hypothetical protein n=1 Tax=Rhodococcoides fascians TaxID=1828 RepID=UPI00050C82E3|nr:hypothetical protein [Rhodococcus fascians]MBY4384946.1 hypothetical protein [Rhodococcus fascians]MBY4399510.1 hypothetical protein [Rhodococcus fascians]MBY4409243.1 hypothetical protein [Rhodococcus fascians]MBY4424139.1 hypothetical protein [Rhodococcus fascians]MBY4463489.1 hypothetical protein [Rhodococcus fascians]